MKRVLAVTLALAASVALAPSASAAKSLSIKSKGWLVYDGVGTSDSVPKGGTYTRCVNNPDTPPVIGLRAKFDIKNKPLPKGAKLILNGPSKLHIVFTNPSKVGPGNGFSYRFDSFDANRESFGPGKYTFRAKVGGTTKSTQIIKLVDNTSC